MLFCLCTVVTTRGRSRISTRKGGSYKGVGVRYADFISFFLNVPVFCQEILKQETYVPCFQCILGQCRINKGQKMKRLGNK